MIRLLSLTALALLAGIAPVASLAASDGIACDYAAQGPTGVLTIVNGAGRPYTALAAGGSVVAAGVVTSSFFVTPVVGAALGQLLVRVGDEVFLTGDRNAAWE